MYTNSPFPRGQFVCGIPCLDKLYILLDCQHSKRLPFPPSEQCSLLLDLMCCKHIQLFTCTAHSLFIVNTRFLPWHLLTSRHLVESSQYSFQYKLQQGLHHQVSSASANLQIGVDGTVLKGRLVCVSVCACVFA